MKVYYVPLEILDKRYTKMQDRVTREAFMHHDLSFYPIEPKVKQKDLEEGQFLNPYTTNMFKFEQLKMISKLFNNDSIKDGDVFYISDLWFPGIEAVKYMAYFKDINIKIYGVLHAGSFTPTDTVNGMQRWARHLELGWIKLCSGVFLGSEQTRQDLINAFPLEYEDLNKLHVTGLAYDSKEVERYREEHVEKENIIVFPHRLHPEKQEPLFNQLKQFFPKCEFVTTQKHDLSKEDYYKLLSKAKIMFSASLQENFGYATLEACSLGCTPVLPLNNTAYKFMYPKDFLYKTFEESVSMIAKYLKCPVDLRKIPRRYDDSVKRQVQVIVDNG